MGRARPMLRAAMIARAGRFGPSVLLVATLLAGLAAPVHAGSPELSCGQWRVRIDNDVFGRQDQGYSSGLMLDWAVPMVGEADGDCGPALPARVGAALSDWLPSGEAGERSLQIWQAVYTPRTRGRRDVIANDRPYAGIVMAGISQSAATGTLLRTNRLQIGLVGPSAQGRLVQDLTHEILGMDRFRGWSNQLHDEPLLQASHERRQRWSLSSRAQAIGSAAVQVGNLASDLSVGLELRAGARLPDDFGTAPGRPGLSARSGSMPRTRASAPRQGGWRWAGFLSAGGRFVARDLTLDGNTFRRSHRVERTRWVADLGYGVAMTLGDWEVLFGRYHRSREFRGQVHRPIYGSITVSRRF